MEVSLQLLGVAVTPLNETVLVPWVAPKFAPATVTAVPTSPEVGDKLLIDGGGIIVNTIPLLACPFTVTTTLPVAAPAGTGTTIEVALQLVGVAATPLNETVLVPWVAPKFAPATVTTVPTSPEVGDKLLIDGGTVTVNVIPLLFTPLACTITLPVVAPDGTAATMDVELQLVTVANSPLKLTVLDPCVVPKFVPAIVTDVPTGPELGERLVMAGAATTVNATPLLLTPLVCTTTFPVVAPAGTDAMIELAL